jgi:hypothetical protein
MTSRLGDLKVEGILRKDQKLTEDLLERIDAVLGTDRAGGSSPN